MANHGVVSPEALYGLADDIYVSLFPQAPMPIPANWENSPTCYPWAQRWATIVTTILSQGKAELDGPLPLPPFPPPP